MSSKRAKIKNKPKMENGLQSRSTWTIMDCNGLFIVMDCHGLLLWIVMECCHLLSWTVMDYPRLDLALYREARLGHQMGKFTDIPLHAI